MPILDLQKRARELGRIRLGVRETVSRQDGSTYTKPAKLDRFRFTSNSRPLLEKIATLYGGEVREWTPEGGTQAWEVISDATRVPIMVPPQPVTQWHEFWTRAGCIHRCDGQRNVLTDEPCDLDEQVKVGKKTVNPHTEAMAKPTTRLNVVLRDVEGIGVWRVETHGWNAAIEIPDAAEFLAYAGGYVNGWLSLEQRTSIDNTVSPPITRHFMVPIIEIDVTPAQLMAGHGRVAAPELTGGPVGDRPALAAAGPDYVALAADLTDPEAVRNLWRQANAAGHMTQGLSEHLQKRVADIEAAAQTPRGEAAATTPEPAASPTPDADGVVDAELVEDQGDADAVWAQIMAIAASRGLTTTEAVQEDCKAFLSIPAGVADAAELGMYLDELRARPEVAA